MSRHGQALQIAGSAGGISGNFFAGKARERALGLAAGSAREFAGDLEDSAAFDFLRGLRDRDSVLADLEEIYASAGVELAGAPMAVLVESARRITENNILIRTRTLNEARGNRIKANELERQKKKQELATTVGLFSDTAQAIGGFI